MSEPTATAHRPATFRDVLANREFTAVFLASSLSWFGDYAARAAITALVYQRTGSVAASAAAFAISYLPWLGIGSLLASLAERHSYRRVMIHCDLLRMGLMATIAVAELPIWGMITLLFATSLLNPPFEAARSALQARLLDGDRYVVGLAMQKSAAQGAIVLGYVAGAGLATFDARLALLFNAATFGISALLIAAFVADRPPGIAADQRTGLVRETAAGFGMVFRTPLLRAIAILVFAESFFTIVPEGLAAGWAATLTESTPDRGLYQAIIMIAGPVGFIAGGLLISRLVAPATRIRLIRPLAVLAPLALVPALLSPGIYVIAAMNALCGFALGGLMPVANGLFVRAVPVSFRARAFGVVQSGGQIVQGAAVLGAGVLADWIALPVVAGLWAAVGVLALLVVITWWPGPETLADAMAAGWPVGDRRVGDRRPGPVRTAAFPVQPAVLTSADLAATQPPEVDHPSAGRGGLPPHSVR